jgi:hypothetical protein
MKLELNRKGNILIKDASDNILQLIRGDFKSIYVDTGNDDILYLSEVLQLYPFNANQQAVKIDITDVTHFNGVTFSGDVQDIIAAFDVASRSALAGDYITMITDGDYQLQQDFEDPLEVQFIKTTVTGTEVEKTVFRSRVVDTAALETLWANRAFETYANLIDL